MRRLHRFDSTRRDRKGGSALWALLGLGLTLAAAAPLGGCALVYSYDDYHEPATVCGDREGLGTALWSEGFGATTALGSASDAFLAMLGMTVDPAGNTILLGLFQGTVTMGESTFATTGGLFGVVLAKLDPSGGVLWARRLGEGSLPGALPGGASNPYLGNVAADAEGNIVLGLTFAGELSLDGSNTYSNPGYGDVLVAKLRPDGSVIWSEQAGDGNSQLLTDVAVGENGTIAITGLFNGGLMFNVCAPLLGPPGGAGGFDVFVATLDSAGTCQWASKFQDAAAAKMQRGLRVALGEGSSMAVGGLFQDNIVFDAGHVLTALSPDIPENFVVSLDEASGKIGFARSMGQGPGLVRVALNEEGEIIVATSVTNGLPVDGDILPVGKQDVGLMKLALDGNIVWGRLFGGAGDDYPTSVALDPAGNVLLTGSFEQSATFGSRILASTGSKDIFFVELDKGGNLYSSVQFGNEDYQEPSELRLLPCGETMLGGQYQGKLDFGGGNGAPPPRKGVNVFVTRFTQ